MDITSRRTFLRHLWKSTTDLPLSKQTVIDILHPEGDGNVIKDYTDDQKYIMLIILDKLNLIDLRNNDLTKSILRNAYAAAKKLNYTFNNKTVFPLLKFIDLLPNIPTFDADAYREYWSTNHFIPDDYPEDNDPACQYAMSKAENIGDPKTNPCEYCPLGCSNSDRDTNYLGVCNRPGVVKYNDLLQAYNILTRYYTDTFDMGGVRRELDRAREQIKNLADNRLTQLPIRGSVVTCR